nr:MAG TPA: hypothetical protein [Caudoviricetes sp.]
MFKAGKKYRNHVLTFGDGSTKVQQSKNHEIRLVNVQSWQEVPQSRIDVRRMPKRGLEGRKKFLRQGDEDVPAFQHQ